LAEELKERDDDIKINIFLPGMIETNLEKNTKVLEEWKDEETFRRESSIVFAHIGANIDDSSKKVIPYVLPSCKKNGKQFRGFSMLKMIRGGMKLRGALKESQ
jgi:short-subunit dehydrogenase